MGGFLSQPMTIKESNHGNGLGLRYGMSSMQGWRLEMEDAHDLRIGLDYGLHDWSFFAVFDGHAGKHTSCYASLHLLDHILKDQEFRLCHSEDNKSSSTKDNISDDGPERKDESIQQTKDDKQTTEPHHSSSSGEPIKKHDNTTEESLKSDKVTDQHQDARFDSYPLSDQLFMVERAIKSGFLRIDQTMRADRKDMSGSTAVCAFISPTHYFMVNCGDSRAVLYDGVFYNRSTICPKFASEDHKPSNPTERLRIINAGGYATERVNGTLAVSRSLGDFEFKKNELKGPCEQLVSPEPEITVIERQPTDQFLILACDGIWDVVNNVDLCNFVEYNLKIESDLEAVCSNVLDCCLRMGSRDNMSIIIVVFENGPKIDPQFIEKVKEDDAKMLNLFDSLMNERPNESLSNLISSMHLELLNYGISAPPFFGPLAKYDMLSQRFDEKSPKSGVVDQRGSEERTVSESTSKEDSSSGQ